MKLFIILKPWLLVWVGVIGKDNEKILKYILENFEFPIIIDADGLNVLSKIDKSILNKSKSKIILTPHLKEFERLTNIPIDEIKLDRKKFAIDFAKKYNVILLLKGATTIVTDGEQVIEVTKGCSGMSTAGRGDVLSGILVRNAWI